MCESFTCRAVCEQALFKTQARILIGSSCSDAPILLVSTSDLWQLKPQCQQNNYALLVRSRIKVRFTLSVAVNFSGSFKNENDFL